MAVKPPPGEMPAWRMAIYALPALPIAFLYVPLSTLLPAFYARELGLSLSAVGGLLLVARLFDIVIDPVLGRWSDHTQTRYGRRRPWMIIGAPIIMLGAWLSFMPPQNADGWTVLGGILTLYLGASMTGVSYSAWGAEIVESYHGRAKVAGFREGANVIGIVIAAAVPAITATSGHGIDRTTMSLMGWVMIVMTPITIFAAVRSIPEPMHTVQQSMPWLRAMVTVFRNKPFALLCAAYFIIFFGASITNTTLIFFISDYLGQPELVGPVLLASFGAVLFGVPIWVLVSRRIGKHRAAGVSLLISVCLSAFLALQLRPGDGWLFVALMAMLGVISAAFLTLPLGIVGDVIDYDTLRTGHTRGGLYFGVWSFFQYASPALAIGLTLPLLEAMNFSATGENTPQALNALRYLYCLGPTPLFIVGAVMFLRFPLDARRHDIIRRRLESLRARAARTPAASVAPFSLPPLAKPEAT